MTDLLRTRLQEITESGGDWPPKINALRSECAHSIREVHLVPPGRYNCFAFALGLHQSDKYLLVARHEAPNIFANAAFVLHLVHERVLRPTDCAGPGQKVIVYLRDGMPTHAGVLVEQRVTSKWGDGPFFEHAVSEVPVNYGCESECYDSASPSQIEAAFLLYAQRLGVQMENVVAESINRLTRR